MIATIAVPAHLSHRRVPPAVGDSRGGGDRAHPDGDGDHEACAEHEPVRALPGFGFESTADPEREPRAREMRGHETDDGAGEHGRREQHQHRRHARPS